MNIVRTSNRESLFIFVFCALSVDLFLAKIDFKAVFLRFISFVVVKRRSFCSKLSPILAIRTIQTVSVKSAKGVTILSFCTFLLQINCTFSHIKYVTAVKGPVRPSKWYKTTENPSF